MEYWPYFLWPFLDILCIKMWGRTVQSVFSIFLDICEEILVWPEVFLLEWVWCSYFLWVNCGPQFSLQAFPFCSSTKEVDLFGVLKDIPGRKENKTNWKLHFDAFKTTFWGARQCLWPYLVENTSSRPITEVKQPWAWLVLGWVTAWEYQVL